MEWSVKGNGTASDLFGDQLVFRDLQPIQPSLPSIQDLRRDLGISENRIPRNLDADYGRVIARILQAAQELRNSTIPLTELIYIGDTYGSDGTAFRHILDAGN
jgi:hypothetical protein